MFQAQLPDTMPSLFSATYTPIAKAGTQSQIKHVARLLATQLNALGLGPGASLAKETLPATKVSVTVIEIYKKKLYVLKVVQMKILDMK